MKTKTSQKATDSASTSADIALVQHYWNNDSTKEWTARELEEEVGDMSSLRPLLKAGHYYFPGTHEITCQTRAVRGGALFRMFCHEQGLFDPGHYGPVGATCCVTGIPRGLLYAVGGVAADETSADTIWELLQLGSTPLYMAHAAGLGMLSGCPVAGISHTSRRPTRPRRFPWLSFMSYAPKLDQKLTYFPDGGHPLLWIANEWLLASVTAEAGKEEE